FSHGRSKQVTVEVRKKRVITPGAAPEAGYAETAPAPTVARAQPAAPAAAPAPTAEPARRLGGTPRTLTAEEHATRVRVLQDARQRAEEDARRRVEEDEARKRGEEDARKRSEDEEARRREEESRREVAERAGKAAAAKVAALAAAGKVAMPAEEEEEAASARPGRRVEAKRPAAPVRRADEQRRRTGKLTVTRALDDDAGERMRSLASVRRARERERQRLQQAEQTKVVRDVVVPETITIQELANRMAERGADVIKALMRMG